VELSPLWTYEHEVQNKEKKQKLKVQRIDDCHPQDEQKEGKLKVQKTSDCHPQWK